MEQKLDLIINMIKDQGVSLNSKIDGVEKSLNSKIDDLREEMNGKYDSLKEEMNGKYDSLKANVSRIETKLDNLSNQVTVLEDYAHEKCQVALDGWASHLEKQEEIKNNITVLDSKTENHEIRISVLEDALEA